MDREHRHGRLCPAREERAQRAAGQVRHHERLGETRDSRAAHGRVAESVERVAPLAEDHGAELFDAPLSLRDRRAHHRGLRHAGDSRQLHFSLEESILGNVTTDALVRVVVAVTGSCTSAVGGALTVISPAGTTVTYFSSSNIPGGVNAALLVVLQ